MTLRRLIDRIQIHRRHHGALATARFLASRIVRQERHVVFEAVLDRAPENIPWSNGERLSIIDRGNIDSLMSPEMRTFLGGDNAADNLNGVRNGDELFVVAKDAEYHHRGYILFRTPQTKIIGEPDGPPLIACCFTSPAARGRGLYRRALIAELRHLWAHGYRRVVIETAPENMASRRGIEAAGFRLCREVRALIVLNRLVYHKRIEPAGQISRLFLI